MPVARDDTLFGRIADGLAQAIRSGALASGERLPSVRELARRHGVSLSTAVQALRTLEDARLVQARPRSGYFVAPRPRSLPRPAESTPPRESLRVERSTLAQFVLAKEADPAVTSFGLAYPGADLFDHTLLRKAVMRAAQRQGASLLHGAPGIGAEPLRRAIARHLLRLGSTVAPEGIVITHGTLEAVTLALRAVTQPGDVVAVESPSYAGLLHILEQLGLRALEIPTCPNDGLSLSALELALRTQSVKAVLCVPTLSNPTGACMAQTRRQRLVRLLGAHGVPLVEDVVWNDLAETDALRRTVHSHDAGGGTLLCGSFTKTLAPGLRLGFVATGRWHARIQGMKLATSGGQTAVMEHALADLLAQRGLEAHYRRLRQHIGTRMDEARELIARHFPAGTRVTDPAGGYLLWLELPGQVDTLALLRQGLAEGICFAPGAMFSASDRFDHCLRLAVGANWDTRRRAALARIGALAAQAT